jgi:glutamate--cysteine ligase
MVRDWDFEERVEFLVAAAKDGLSARTTRGSAKDLAAEFVAISSEGLRRIAHAGHGEPDETSFLAPLQEQIASGKSPGELLLEKWEGEWNHSLPRLMDYARYC